MTERDTAIAEAAARLRGATESGRACAPIAPLLPEGDLAAAYAVQQANVAEGLARGRRIVGRKIGLTSPAVQKQLGVSQPDFGTLFADMACAEGLEIDLGRLMQPKIEAEIAFVLERDLPAAPTVAELIAAVAFALPAIEIVDSRVADWKIGILDTIADNASSGLYVLGAAPRRLDAIDLRLCGMVIEHKGEPVSVGAGAACLGSPANAATWLAGVMAENGTPLKAGDVILTGALGPMVPVAPGGVYTARISGFDPVSAIFSNPVGASA